MKPKFSGKSVRWTLMIYDFLFYCIAALLLLVIYPNANDHITAVDVMLHAGTGVLSVLIMRFLFGIYTQIWRYASAGMYVRLIMADTVASVIYFLISRTGLMHNITAPRSLSICAFNLLEAISARLVYQILYQHSNKDTSLWRKIRKVFAFFTGVEVKPDKAEAMSNRIRIAIVGAGHVGTSLAKELLSNGEASYFPVCFIDTDAEKAGRNIFNVPVLSDTDATKERLDAFKVQEIVFALPEMNPERKKELYNYYRTMSYRLKVYDYSNLQTAEPSGRRTMRSFDIEELLFRTPVKLDEKRITEYYTGKTILVTGGGGSIGSEICRQLAKMKLRQMIILDVYENGAYDLQQELKLKYGNELNVAVEICTVCDRQELDKIFDCYHPDIVIHAAAHKHVPLMEHNVCEAIKNNIFGTKNVLDACDKFGTGRFLMVSTDKAVNPTNVMGATKRIDEMMVLGRKSGLHTSATRFGNVLGSAGSVIPLFRRQIANGGPITVTDKRIVRYFMTIPEASRLVLLSGAMAKPGELFVLDMGKPVKILELAENMITLSGLKPYQDIDIIETGLRPGEKLYEELLVKTENLDKTENSLIFIERDAAVPPDEMDAKLALLKSAVDSNDDAAAYAALKKTVPTFHSPKHVNAKASQAAEMNA